MSNCNCFKDRLKGVEPKILSQIPDGAIDIDIRWQNYSFFFGGGDYSPVNPKINIEYRAIKKNGAPAKNLKKSDVSIIADYCCFCGRKLDKDSSND